MNDLARFCGNGLLIQHVTTGAVCVTGSERISWLQGIVTADLLRAPGGALWGLLLDRTGKIRFEVIGLLGAEAVLLFALNTEPSALCRYLDSMAIMEDVVVEERDNLSLWGIHGSAAVIAEIDASRGGREVYGRLPWVGLQDIVVAVPQPEQTAWLAAMAKAGCVPADASEWDYLRIMAGLPKWGIDYSAQDTPHHASLFGRAVAPDKGCYVGQEVVCKVEMRGKVAQRLARLDLTSAVGVAAGMPVVDSASGETIGNVTSVQSDASRHPAYALARVKSALIERNAEITVGNVSGTVRDPGQS
jgi:folate-binding protein YgfZ